MTHCRLSHELDEQYWMALGKLCDIASEPNGRINHQRDNYKHSLKLNREVIERGLGPWYVERAEAHLRRVIAEVNALYEKWKAEKPRLPERKRD